MAVLQAFSALDMLRIIRDGGTFRGGDGAATLRSGDWRTTFSGKFQETATGFVGGLSEISQKHHGDLVFEATSIGRGARPAFSAVEARDNDRFLTLVLSGDDRIAGSAADDNLLGFGGADRIGGGAGDDKLSGGGGRDVMNGGGGADFLVGGLDDDRLIGGKGDDRFLVDSAGDEVIEKAGGGDDMILSLIDVRIASHVERLLLLGDADLTARGSSGTDSLLGNVGSNRLFGGGGRDVLNGNLGKDSLDGGKGGDTLFGGGGADTFRFGSRREADGDWIGDFGTGADRLDLSGFDANANRSGVQRFDFIRDHAFSGHAGELGARPGALAGDVDGDEIADFTIRFGGGIEVRGDDLIL